MKRISFSAISAYMSCPKKFYFQRIMGIKPDYLPSAFIFGGAVHEGLAEFNRGRREGIVADVATMMQAYYHEWRKRAAEGLPIQYMRSESESYLEALAERMFRAFLDFSKKSGEPFMIEEWVRAKLSPELPKFVGIIDLAEYVNREVVITDYKTAGKPRQHDFTQMLLYRYALLKSGCNGAAKAKLRYVTLTKEAQPRVIEQWLDDPEFSQERTGRIIKQYEQAYADIKAEKFDRRTSWQCQYCVFAEACRSHKPSQSLHN